MSPVSDVPSGGREVCSTNKAALPKVETPLWFMLDPEVWRIRLDAKPDGAKWRF